MLERCNIRPIYKSSVHDLSDYINALREGDEVWVTSMGRLAAKRGELKRAVDLIHGKKCVIVEAASERRSDRDGAGMALDAADELMGEGRMLSPEQARKHGAKGGKANAKLVAAKFAKTRMALAEARKIWTDPDLATLSNARVLKQMPGWAQQAAYRHIGPRGLAKGRPRSNGTMRESARPGHIYFLQNGRRKLVKIGFSSDHATRIGNIQMASPDKLKLIATIPGSRLMEAELHKRFAQYHVQGEWFSVDGSLATYLARLKE